MLTEGDIRRITSRIASRYAPLVLGTFGAYAIGSTHDGSDLDLFLIKRTPESAPAFRREIQRLLFGVLHPLDIHVFTAEGFEESVYEEPSFPWVIARQARLDHLTEDAKRQVPSLFERVPAHSG